MDGYTASRPHNTMGNTLRDTRGNAVRVLACSRRGDRQAR